MKRVYLALQNLTVRAYRVLTSEQLSPDPWDAEAGPSRQLPATSASAAVPLVSVIIRSMGRESLNEALDSVVAQTYPHIEILVVDAKGQDHPELPGWWGRFPLRLIQSGTRLPRARAANVGLENARGDYLIFLDDDDVFYPDHIATLADALRGQKNVRCAYAGVRVEYYVGGELGPLATFNAPFQRQKLWSGNYIPIHALLFERALLSEGCRFDEQLAVFEDWDFWVQLAQHTEFLHIDRVSACYRNHGHSGLGAQMDEQHLRQAKAAFFEKWKGIWSGEQVDELIAYQEARVAYSEQVAASLRQQLNEQQAECHRQRLALEQAIADKDSQLVKLERLAKAHAHELTLLHRSRSWRLMAPYRWVGRQCQRVWLRLGAVD